MHADAEKDGFCNESNMNMDLLAINVLRMGGTLPSVISLPSNATFGDLKEAATKACAVGPFAFKLVTKDFSILEGSLDTKLIELGVQDGADLTMITDSARDYSKISAPEKVLKTGNYPAGLLIDQEGNLYVSHYFGGMKVYDRNFELIRELKLPKTEPKQITLGPDGELVIVFPGSIGVFDPITCEAKRWFGEFKLSRGIAIDGDVVYVSDTRTNAIQTYRFSDGEALATYTPGLSTPCGLAIVDEWLLAVADRMNDRVLLLDKESMITHAQLPAEDAPKAHKLREPNDVKVDSGGNLLIMDTKNQRIAVFRSDGTFVASVLENFFKCSSGSYCNLCYNRITGAIAASNDDAHCITVFAPIFSEATQIIANDTSTNSQG